MADFDIDSIKADTARLRKEFREAAADMEAESMTFMIALAEELAEELGEFLSYMSNGDTRRATEGLTMIIGLIGAKIGATVEATKVVDIRDETVSPKPNKNVN